MSECPVGSFIISKFERSCYTHSMATTCNCIVWTCVFRDLATSCSLLAAFDGSCAPATRHHCVQHVLDGPYVCHCLLWEVRMTMY